MRSMNITTGMNADIRDRQIATGAGTGMLRVDSLQLPRVIAKPGLRAVHLVHVPRGLFAETNYSAREALASWRRSAPAQAC